MRTLTQGYLTLTAATMNSNKQRYSCDLEPKLW